MREMPEILFRGKRVDNGEWVYGFYVHIPCGRFQKSEYLIQTVKKSGKIGALVPVICETVGLYTGLTDKNGVKIFGDDIVHVHDITLQCSKPYHEFEGYVDFSFGIFQILDANGMDHFQWPDYEIEVIGNIHDNPELLEGGGGEDV